MDGSRFDTLTRSLGTAGSRRRALGGLLAGTLGILGWQDGDEILAHDLKDKCKKKSGDAKKRCLKKAKKHAAQHAAETPPPPGPTCSDRVKNGSESDVDCGGSCQRCVNGKRCSTFRDCLSGLCGPDGTCQACEGFCPPGCLCFDGVCGSNAGATATPDCNTCPPGTATCADNPIAGGWVCFPYCNG